MEPNSIRMVCNLVCIFFLARHVCDSRQVRYRNIGDRYGLFLFLIPNRYINSTLGPETYGWLVRRYGQATVDRANILPAPSDDHHCGQDGGWCRFRCTDNDVSDWMLKDVCGRYQCCVPSSAQKN
ncbi:big defensin-like [Haliotis rufescens]|uniref:big defensin-like n=1 Tax=Haliotis rufescens TaxID=6454 RepID=UPI001EAFA0E7|nr:big defensin-like [Haliotis rufescens]